jgi:hypothetical protein
MSTSWPWPYPPVALKYPQSQQYRADPGNEQDGMGSLSVEVQGGNKSQQIITFQPFADSLTPFLKNLKV